MTHDEQTQTPKVAAPTEEEIRILTNVVSKHAWGISFAKKRNIPLEELGQEIVRLGIEMGAIQDVSKPEHVNLAGLSRIVYQDADGEYQMYQFWPPMREAETQRKTTKLNGFEQIFLFGGMYLSYYGGKSLITPEVHLFVPSAEWYNTALWLCPTLALPIAYLFAKKEQSRSQKANTGMLAGLFLFFFSWGILWMGGTYGGAKIATQLTGQDYQAVLDMAKRPQEARGPKHCAAHASFEKAFWVKAFCAFLPVDRGIIPQEEFPLVLEGKTSFFGTLYQKYKAPPLPRVERMGAVKAFEMTAAKDYISTDAIKDLDKAEFYLTRLAESEDSESQFLLGSFYLVSGGEKVDPKKGESWLAKSAANKNPDAAFHLAMAYYKGKYGIQQNEKMAMVFLHLAAKNGHEGAKKALGMKE